MPTLKAGRLTGTVINRGTTPLSFKASVGVPLVAPDELIGPRADPHPWAMSPTLMPRAQERAIAQSPFFPPPFLSSKS